jgi:hypothetical protein
MLVHLPDGYKPEQVAPALAAKIQSRPQAVRQSLTWDQGPEMRDWKQVKLAADIAVFFCDPHAPWQRGTKENEEACAQRSTEATRLSCEDDKSRRVICSVDPVGHFVGPDVDA